MGLLEKRRLPCEARVLEKFRAIIANNTTAFFCRGFKQRLWCWDVVGVNQSGIRSITFYEYNKHNFVLY